MELKTNLLKIFGEVQQSSSCHQRCIAKLIEYYNSTPYEDFAPLFLNFITKTFFSKISTENNYLDRCIKFSAQFVSKLADSSGQNEEETNPLVMDIIRKALKYTISTCDDHRYQSSKFITILMSSISDETSLDCDICDEIQDALILRSRDQKAVIRIVALEGLFRLQNPNTECSVINAITSLLKDSDMKVRKVAIETIALSINSIPKIILRLRDINPKVRSAAFKKLSAYNITLLKIEARRNVLTIGFSECDTLPKTTFEEVLIPKWLTYLNGDYLKFIDAIKFDADENDFKTTAAITEKLMKIIFKKRDVEDIISNLPLGKDKLIPMDKLTNESILFWSNLQKYIIDSKEHAEYMDSIIPELSTFSDYISKYIQLLHESVNKKFEVHQQLENQFIVQKMLEMAGRFDFSEEAGKQILKNLIIKMLEEDKLVESVTDILVEILAKIFKNAEELQDSIVDILTSMQIEEVVEPSEVDLSNWRFQIAQLKMKSNELTDEIESAIKNREFNLACDLEESGNKLKERIKLLEAQKPEGKKSKNSLCNELVIYKRLDILNALLQLASIKTLKAMVQEQIKDLMNLLNDDSISVDVQRRVFKLIGLASICDENFATVNWKTICLPIRMYRVVPYFKQDSMFIAIPVFSDLLRLYGPSLFKYEENPNISKRSNKIRKLYNVVDFNESESTLCDYYTCEDMVEILTDMLDDENSEMREKAAESVSKLISNGVMVSSGILTRIILKCCNSTYAEQNPRINQLFLFSIFQYCSSNKGKEEVVERAVESVLTSILTAEKPSSLAEIDIDNVIKFLTNITSPHNNYSVHKNLAYTFCNIIANNIHDKAAAVYAKFLISLAIPNDINVALELKGQANNILEDVQDKTLRIRLNKYIGNLQKALLKLQELSEVDTTTNINSTLESTLNKNLKKLQLETIIEDNENNNSQIKITTPEKNNIERNNIKENNVTDQQSNQKVTILSNQVIVQGSLENKNIISKSTNETKNRKEAIMSKKLIVNVQRSPSIAKMLKKIETPLKSLNLNKNVLFDNVEIDNNCKLKTQPLSNFKTTLCSEESSESDIEHPIKFRKKINTDSNKLIKEKHEIFLNKTQDVNENAENSSPRSTSSSLSFNTKINNFKRKALINSTSRSSSTEFQTSPAKFERTRKYVSSIVTSVGSSEEFLNNSKTKRTNKSFSSSQTSSKRKASPKNSQTKTKKHRTESTESVNSNSPIKQNVMKENKFGTKIRNSLLLNRSRRESMRKLSLPSTSSSSSSPVRTENRKIKLQTEKIRKSPRKISVTASNKIQNIPCKNKASLNSSKITTRKLTISSIESVMSMSSVDDNLTKRKKSNSFSSFNRSDSSVSPVPFVSRVNRRNSSILVKNDRRKSTRIEKMKDKQSQLNLDDNKEPSDSDYSSPTKKKLKLENNMSDLSLLSRSTRTSARLKT